MDSACRAGGRNKGELPVVSSAKFKPGQTVMIAERRYEQTPRGMFRVVRALPAERGVRLYRVQSVADGHERVVSENELT
jgi:hypothetical protein